MKKVVMVHGWEGRAEEGWRPWLRQKLVEKGFKVEAPQMPNTDHPKMDEWVEHLRKHVGTPNKDIILLGHSLGGITILRYLEGLKQGEKIGAAIFFAGFSYDLHHPGYKGELSNFFQTPVNFEEVKKHCAKFVVVYSRDDPGVTLEHTLALEKNLNIKAIIQDGMKHYSGDDGFTEMPIALEIIEKVSA